MNGLNLKQYFLTNCGIALIALSSPAVAQITPDTTLPNSSIVETQNPRSLITGGTRVQDNLFHSFSEFSVPTGGSAIFNNDLSIQNIFTRVTGGNLSTIDGLIQTNGAANFFLLNPNGILFGANARLNIGGSFAASTGDRLTFGSQGDYSATNPQAPPLLTISVPIGLGIPLSGSTIVNQGILTVPQTFTLQSDQLQLEGQINAGQDLILRSTNPITSNAQFNTGGSFWIEDFNSSLGSLISSGGTRIRSLGDVNFGRYQGASLQILAGGSINIPNGIRIDSVGNGTVDRVTLSDGTNFAINSQTELTIDIRAGVRPEILNLNGNATPTRSDIQIGGISFADIFGNSRIGNTLITNQFEPNLALPGNINLNAGINAVAIFTRGLNLAIDSRSNVNINNVLLGFSIYENGGDTKILAQGNVDVPYINTASSFKNGGNITIDAGGTLNLLEGLLTRRADSLKKRKEVRNVVSQMTNAFRDGGKTMQSKQVKGDCAEDCKISWSIAITERSDVLTHDDIFRIVEAILNVPMLSDTTAQFFGIRRQGTKVEHGFVNWLSATNTRALDANQALHTYPSCIQSRQGFQNTDRALRGAVSRMFNVICDAISRMLLKLGCNPFVKLGLILLDGNHVVIATVDDLLNGFFGCARHPY
ncbi:unknown protein [Leptolyngbya sp. NIES-3755]|nr:unknown protein [Leptolyngbya sp. NIES-3755]